MWCQKAQFSSVFALLLLVSVDQVASLNPNFERLESSAGRPLGSFDSGEWLRDGPIRQPDPLHPLSSNLQFRDLDENDRRAKNSLEVMNDLFNSYLKSWNMANNLPPGSETGPSMAEKYEKYTDAVRDYISSIKRGHFMEFRGAFLGKDLDFLGDDVHAWHAMNHLRAASESLLQLTDQHQGLEKITAEYQAAVESTKNAVSSLSKLKQSNDILTTQLNRRLIPKVMHDEVEVIHDRYRDACGKIGEMIEVLISKAQHLCDQISQQYPEFRAYPHWLDSLEKESSEVRAVQRGLTRDRSRGSAP